MSRSLSDYLVFVDESGSPSMGNIDPDYPLFVLAFLISDCWELFIPPTNKMTMTLSRTVK